ncbi:MAG: DUF4097 family beta strand repeat-containing protein [Acidimicrobiia bacterium]|nr:DUF4097 family beta strand repeat-containing protein [Acidimicrobiia bacterium]
MNNYEFDVDSNTSLDVYLTAGRVDIRPGEQGRIEVVVDTNDPKFEVSQRGGQIYISSDRDSRWASGRNSANVVIKAPEGTDATISTATANIDSTVRLGDVFIKSATADVELNEIHSGNVKTASGDVEIGRVSDYLKVASASGDVMIGRCEGKAECSAASGDVHIRDCEGPVKANSASGDITLGRFAGDRASFKTMSGDVTVGVPAGTKINLDVTTLSGELRLPERSDDAEPVTPTRKISLRAKLVSGDLILKRVEE